MEYVDHKKGFLFQMISKMNLKKKVYNIRYETVNSTEILINDLKSTNVIVFIHNRMESTNSISTMYYSLNNAGSSITKTFSWTHVYNYKTVSGKWMFEELQFILHCKVVDLNMILEETKRKNME